MMSKSTVSAKGVNAKPIDAIILDASPILTNNPSFSSLLTRSEKIYTVPSIIDEIRDPNARSRLETTVLPFLTIRTPSPGSIKFVTDFARKTGDYSVLSKPDIQILALTYELECELNNGDWRLRRSPGQKGLNGPLPQKTQNKAIRNAEPPQNAEDSASIADAMTSKDPSLDALEERHQHVPANAEPDVNQVSSELEAVNIAENDQYKSQGIDFSTPKVADSAVGTAPEVDSLTFDSDSDGWITPSNLKKQQAKDQNASIVSTPEDQSMAAATITGDFAMQNVLLQIGLNLLSPSFHRIKTVKTYILRCHACFEKVKDMSKQFCPKCGKPTLTRVSCSTNQKGEFKIHLKKNMQWNHRGDRYSIPKPVPGTANGKVGQSKGGGKGGWGQELILAEDQKEYVRATSGRKGKKEIDLMDVDYLPGILTGARGRNGGRPKIGAGRNVNSKKRT